MQSLLFFYVKSWFCSHGDTRDMHWISGVDEVCLFRLCYGQFVICDLCHPLLKHNSHLTLVLQDYSAATFLLLQEKWLLLLLLLSNQGANKQADKWNYPMGTHWQLCQSPNVSVNELRYRFYWSHWITSSSSSCSSFLLLKGSSHVCLHSFWSLIFQDSSSENRGPPTRLLWTMSRCWAV